MTNARLIGSVLTFSLLLLSAGSPGWGGQPGSGRAKKEGSGPMASVNVRLVGPDGKLMPPAPTPKLVLSDAQWKERLTPEQFKITRGKGTERAFCGGLLDNKEQGLYVCLCCNLPLFESTSKFESGTGWPSFFRPAAKENIREEIDRSHGMVRVEILCMRCDAHLGHVFRDGPRPTGLRYCLNSDAMRFVPADQVKSLADDAQSSVPPPGERAEAVFAGGCFWCVEAVFEQLDGVFDAVSGYAGGTAQTANYAAVSTGRTGHAEAVKIVYDPQKVSFDQLLRVHFATHDPTTLNRQGNDVGPQYRSAIFYSDQREKELAEAFIADLNDARAFPRPIVTRLEPLKGFYPAEAKHQDFVACNMQHPYVRAIALPKVQKVREKFGELVSPQGAPAKR